PARHHRALRDPRSGRGDDHVRPHLPDERGAHRADRLAVGPVLPAPHALRRRLPRRVEHARGDRGRRRGRGGGPLGAGRPRHPGPRGGGPGGGASREAGGAAGAAGAARAGGRCAERPRRRAPGTHPGRRRDQVLRDPRRRPHGVGGASDLGAARPSHRRHQGARGMGRRERRGPAGVIGADGKPRWRLAWGPLVPALVFLAVVFAYPVLQLLWLSVVDRSGSLTGAHYARLFAAPVYVQVLLITFRIAAWTTVLCILG